MEEDYYVDRAKLRRLMQAHPTWKQGDFVRETGRSLAWVKKWRRRLRQAPGDDESVLRGQSRARRKPPPGVPVKVIERILELRDHPPEALKRTPGPKALLYYLPRDPVLQQYGTTGPRSTRTIWRILKANGRIRSKQPTKHQPLERPEPMSEWQIDFKDVNSVPADPEGKQVHVVEALNIVDAGTSILVDSHVRDDFNAETALLAMVEVLAVNGLPNQVTFDRDPRWVGANNRRDFPSPFVRLWYCLGVGVNICPPRHPEKNPFVERYNGTYGRECLDYFRPDTLQKAAEVTGVFRQHYNAQRPNQALSCGNRPPYAAFPELPSLPPLPAEVDPDAWLPVLHDACFRCKIRRDGFVVVDQQTYYIKQALRGQYVVLRVDAPNRQFVVFHNGTRLKAVPIKGLVGKTLPFQAYVQYIAEQAGVDWSRALARRAVNRRRLPY